MNQESLSVKQSVSILQTISYHVMGMLPTPFLPRVILSGIDYKSYLGWAISSNLYLQPNVWFGMTHIEAGFANRA